MWLWITPKQASARRPSSSFTRPVIRPSGAGPRIAARADASLHELIPGIRREVQFRPATTRGYIGRSSAHASAGREAREVTPDERKDPARSTSGGASSDLLLRNRL